VHEQHDSEERFVKSIAALRQLRRLEVDTAWISVVSGTRDGCEAAILHLQAATQLKTFILHGLDVINGSAAYWEPVVHSLTVSGVQTQHVWPQPARNHQWFR
jgi:hypothetical protein